MMRILAIGACLLTMHAQAAVTDVGANGFEIEHTVHVAATPGAVYDTLVQPASRSSKRLRPPARAMRSDRIVRRAAVNGGSQQS